MKIKIVVNIADQNTKRVLQRVLEALESVKLKLSILFSVSFARFSRVSFSLLCYVILRWPWNRILNYVFNYNKNNRDTLKVFPFLISSKFKWKAFCVRG